MKVFIGYTSRERLAWQVCAASLQARTERPVPVEAICRQDLEAAGLYTRAHSIRDGVEWDHISDAPCATDFAIARFWVPSLAGRSGWALFCDGDFLWRQDVRKLFEYADPQYAAMVVAHEHTPTETMKMDGQRQTLYPRKNWSSLVLWNLAHAGAQRLTQHMLNTTPGRDLHAFCWLKDSEIGALPEHWNWLSGTSDPGVEAAACHYTNGTPNMRGHENQMYAGEWWKYADAFTARVAA